MSAWRLRLFLGNAVAPHSVTAGDGRSPARYRRVHSGQISPFDGIVDRYTSGLISD
jgi:hypothetical protein